MSTTRLWLATRQMDVRIDKVLTCLPDIDEYDDSHPLLSSSCRTCPQEHWYFWSNVRPVCHHLGRAVVDDAMHCISDPDERKTHHHPAFAHRPPLKKKKYPNGPCVSAGVTRRRRGQGVGLERTRPHRRWEEHTQPSQESRYVWVYFTCAWSTFPLHI